MKANKAKRILSLLLALVMALSLLPASALANTLEEQGKADAAQDLLRQMGLTALEDDNSEQTNSVYSIHGKSYKVLFNDYIACYVDMETGGYTILPAAEPLAENAPAGTAVFAIDGTEYVFGGDYPELNSELMPTRVRGDLAITNWVLGDFFITQYQAITQDVGHENSYAVKVAYLAEYLGDASVTPEISTRLVLPARLGEGADGVLYTETGIFLAGPTVMDNVPGEIAMSAEGEGPRTFFVLDSAEGLPHPERMALGEQADLEAGQYPDGMPGVAESQDSAGSGPEAGTGSDWTPTDPATAFDFPSAVLTIPEGDSTTHTNQYGVLVNYGFYQLEEADLELTVDDELTALEEDLTSAGALALTGEGQAELPSVSFELDEALSLRDLRYQKPGESQETPLTLTDNRVSLPAGSTVSFALEPVEPECLQVDEVTLRASEDEGERTETVLTPGEGGRYSFTMPAGDGGISARYKAAPGYVLWEKNYLSPAEIDSMTVDGKPASRFALPLEKTVSVRLVADRPFFLNPEKPEEDWTPPGIYYYAISDDPNQAADFVSIPLTSGNREQGNDGAVTFSFKVPNVSTMKGLGFAVTFDGETGYHNVTSKVIPRGAVVGGTLNINAPKINGIVRVAAQETVTIEAPVLNSAFSETDTTLSAYNLSTGHPITLTCNGATDTAFTVDDIDGQVVTFQMPDADVEVRLSGKEYHRVSAQVEYQDSQGNTLGERNGAYSTNVGVSILPESPVAGDKVTVRLEYDFKPDGNEATLYNPFCPVIDGNTSIVSDKAEASQVSISTEVTGQTYSFTMPDRDVDLKVTMRLLVNPDEAKTKNPIHTLSTRPLVEGNAIRAGIWAWEQYTNQSERPKPAQDGTSARIPAGAKVEYYAYEPDYQDDWHIEGVYLAKAETPEVPLEGYTLEPGYLNSDNTGYRTFIMPDFDCVIVVQGTEGRPIRTEAYSYLPGDDPGDASRDESLDNLVRVYGNAPAWGFSAADPTITAAKQGQSIYVDALELGGYQIESLTLLRDGQEPKTITPWQHRGTGDGPGRKEDFLMGAEGVTIRAVYKADNALTFSFDESKSAGVVKLTYPEGPLKADAVYDDKGQITGYRAGSWVQMENILTDTDQYSIKSGNYNGVTVTVTPGWIMGWVGNAKGSYNLDFFWPANPGTDNPKVTIPIEKVEARYGNTYIYDAIVNHTNPEKFHTVTIDGFDLNAIDFENVYLLAYSADWTTPVAKYKVNKDAITCAENGKTLTLNLASSNLGADDKKGAFPGFRFPTAQATNWAWGLEMTGTKLTQTSTGFEAKDAHFVERFRLYASNMNMSDAKYYLSIMRSTANEYRMYVGRTEADVQPAPGETVLFSFYNRSGFYPQEDGSVVTGPDVTQELGFNGSMTLSKSSSSGKLTVRKDDGGITMEAYNLTMKALGVPLFVPGPGNAANKTLLLRLENGTKYDLSAPADGSGTAKPLTFTSEGVPEIELLGWTGFTAGVEAITVTDRTVDVSGHLWLQWPFGDEQFGGMDLEQLRLKINDGQDVLPAFGGIHAEGAFQMPSLLVLEAGGSAIVNTFEHHYEFEAEAEVGPVSFGGRLKLIKSERFGILVPDAYEVDFNVEDVGVPLVPPTIVAYITGLTGGYENLAETMDWDPIRGKTALPDLRIIFGGHFKLLSVMSLDARFNGGAYDVEGTVSGSIEMGGHGIDFFDYFTLWLGLRNVEGVPLAGSSQARYARLRAGVTTGIGLKISTEKIQDIVKGSTAFGVYIEFNNPVSIAADSIYSFLSAMKDPSSGAPMTLQDFIKAIDLTYVSYGTGDVAVQFPKIGPFGPIRLGGVHADYDVGLKVGLNQGYQLAGAGYVRLVGTADVLGIAGYVVVDLLNSTTQVGVGAPPPFNGYRSRNLSSDGALQVLADTEADTGAAPAALMAQSESEERAAIYAGTDGNTFQYRFTVPGNGGGHLLAVRLLAEDYEPQPPMLKLYDPRGTEVTLNQWDREGQSELALPQQDAKFVVNAIYDDGMNSEDGHEGWLIAIPDQNKALVDKAEGEWTLSASREVAVQLLEQEPMPGIASATTSAATAYAGDPLPLTLSANTVTACFEHLQQNTKYAYSLDLIRRDAPAGADLETIQVRLVEDETAVGMDRYRKSLEVEADGIASVSVPLNAALLPADLARGTYYPGGSECHRD